MSSRFLNHSPRHCLLLYVCILWLLRSIHQLLLIHFIKCVYPHAFLYVASASFCHSLIKSYILSPMLSSQLGAPLWPQLSDSSLNIFQHPPSHSHKGISVPLLISPLANNCKKNVRSVTDTKQLNKKTDTSSQDYSYSIESTWRSLFTLMYTLKTVYAVVKVLYSYLCLKLYHMVCLYEE